MKKQAGRLACILVMVLCMMCSGCLSSRVSEIIAENQASQHAAQQASQQVTEQAAQQTDQQVETPDSVYLIKSATYHYASGSEYDFEWEIGDSGIIQQCTRRGLDGSYTVFLNEEFDEYGSVIRESTIDYSADDTELSRTETIDSYTYEDGRIVAMETEESGSLYEEFVCTYHDNGFLATYERLRVQQGIQEICTYDEQGMLIEYYDESNAAGDQRITFNYRFDEESGYVVGWTAETEDGQQMDFTCETDGAGNVTRVYDESGTLKAEIAYQEVKNPSVYTVMRSVFHWNAVAVRFSTENAMGV